MIEMSHIDQVFEDLKKELVSLVGDLSGVHNAVDNAKGAIAPHIMEPAAKEETNDLRNENNNFSEGTNTP